MTQSNAVVLELGGLEVAALGLRGRVPILRGVDLSAREGEILGLIGESGAGKSMTARAILGLTGPGLEIRVARRRFAGSDIAGPEALAALLGREIGFVPQNPRASLNPVFTVGDQLGDALRRLRGVSRRDTREAAIELLRKVQIPEPERRLSAYPHQLSGGMCQRVCIAIALSGRPRLIIADEPTTGLDVTTQAEILALLQELIREEGSAGILITHDVSVVAEVCDRLAVMYAGRVVEEGPTADLFAAPRHPYAVRLIAIATSLDRGQEPETIPGQMQQPTQDIKGCAFSPRCFAATEVCRYREPPLVAEHGRRAFCHHPMEPICRVTARGPS